MKENFMRKLLSKLYILGSMTLSVVFMIVIWKVTFGHIVEEYHSRKKNLEIAEFKEQQTKTQAATTFQKAILEEEQRVKHYLGYRVLEQRWVKGHFHHIDFDFKPDKRNYCIECHGDLPHDKIKELRAFGNMHASLIACQTCHIRIEDGRQGGVFKWYDRQTGDIVSSPVKQGVPPGMYNAKILPFERIDSKLQRIDTPARIEFAREYGLNESKLSEIQKSKAKNIIHKIVSKKPYMCEDCHQKEAPILALKDLGYPQHRIDTIISTEVIGMIKNYTKFYIPRILDPGVGTENPLQ
jgi:hypothetical protein